MAERSAPDERGLFVELFRIWARARADGENALPLMYARADSRACSPELVPACESYFALTEACLGRALQAEVGAGIGLCPDEVALLAMLRHAPEAGAVQTSAILPHGLPGALSWAACAVSRALGDGLKGPLAIDPRHCPFGHRVAA